jgi:hypothetical protein
VRSCAARGPCGHKYPLSAAEGDLRRNLPKNLVEKMICSSGFWAQKV